MPNAPTQPPDNPSTADAPPPVPSRNALPGVRLRDAAHVWSWFRIDVPARVLPLTAVPLIWALAWGGGVHSVGLSADFALWAWLPLVPLAVIVALVSAEFVRRQGAVGSRATPGALALELSFFLVLNPVAEELFFRGLAQGRLAEYIGFLPALLIVATVFGFHHALAGFQRPFLLLATVGGLLFGTTLFIYGSVLPAIALHIAADIGIFLVGPWWSARTRRATAKPA
jgi:membrane protease YdiL (CAAX protease family)